MGDEKEMTSAIIIVVFNTDRFLEKQLQLLQHFHPEPDIKVIDNSRELQYTANLKGIAETYGCEYVKTVIKEGDPSISHGDACNIAYAMYKDHYDVLFFLDHDIFPIAEWNFTAFMDGKMIAGVPHVKKEHYYFWAGCTIIHCSKIDDKLVDFSPCEYDGVRLDTGGRLTEVIKKYPNQYAFLRQWQISRDLGNPFYNFYENIDDKFLHWINGSYWNTEHETEEEHDNRISQLMELLP